MAHPTAGARLVADDAEPVSVEVTPRGERQNAEIALGPAAPGIVRRARKPHRCVYADPQRRGDVVHPAHTCAIAVWAEFGHGRVAENYPLPACSLDDEDAFGRVVEYQLETLPFALRRAGAPVDAEPDADPDDAATSRGADATAGAGEVQTAGALHPAEEWSVSRYRDSVNAPLTVAAFFAAVDAVQAVVTQAEANREQAFDHYRDYPTPINQSAWLTALAFYNGAQAALTALRTSGR